MIEVQKLRFVWRMSVAWSKIRNDKMAEKDFWTKQEAALKDFDKVYPDHHGSAVTPRPPVPGTAKLAMEPPPASKRASTPRDHQALALVSKPASPPRPQPALASLAPSPRQAMASPPTASKPASPPRAHQALAQALPASKLASPSRPHSPRPQAAPALDLRAPQPAQRISKPALPPTNSKSAPRNSKPAPPLTNLQPAPLFSKPAPPPYRPKPRQLPAPRQLPTKLPTTQPAPGPSIKSLPPRPPTTQPEPGPSKRQFTPPKNPRRRSPSPRYINRFSGLGGDTVAGRPFARLEEDDDSYDDADGTDEEPSPPHKAKRKVEKPPAPSQKKKAKLPIEDSDEEPSPPHKAKRKVEKPPAPSQKKNAKLQIEDSDDEPGNNEEPAPSHGEKETRKVDKPPAHSKKQKKIKETVEKPPAKVHGKRQDAVSNGIRREPPCKLCAERIIECWERTGTGFSCLNCFKWKMRCELQSDDENHQPEDEAPESAPSFVKKRSAPLPDDEPASKKQKTDPGLGSKKKTAQQSKPTVPSKTQPAPKKKKIFKTPENIPTSDGDLVPHIPVPSMSQPVVQKRHNLAPGPEQYEEMLRTNLSGFFLY
jgi:hypothetical protein